MANTSTQRFHGLDSLRATMMLLGLVLHSGVVYMAQSDSAIVSDPKSQSIAVGYLVFWIHAYRLPIFFLVSGFFSALLYFDRGPDTMITNRFKRLVLPFLVGWMLFVPLIAILKAYANHAFDGYAGSWQQNLPVFDMKLYQNTHHLWFLYYLALISFVFWGAAKILHNRNMSQFMTAFDYLVSRHTLAVVVFSIITSELLMRNHLPYLGTDTKILPNLSLLLTYTLFFGIGWGLFNARHLLQTFAEHTWRNLALGTAMFVIYAIVYINNPEYILLETVVYAACTWFYVFGFLGFFIRYLDRASPLIRYLSDSSYWMYLFHFALVIGFAGLLAGQLWPGLVKFSVVTVLTFIVCLISYHWMVRSTFIGLFLYGKKIPRKSD
ncbi:MAG: acyltransferase family protein [Pseudomonadota bacterium]